MKERQAAMRVATVASAAERAPKQDVARHRAEGRASEDVAAAADRSFTNVPLVEPARIGVALLRSWLFLLVANGPRHGYELYEDLRVNGIELGHSSYLYRTLRLMEGEGVIDSQWELSVRCGPPRRVYQLTTSGERALEECAAEVADLAEHLQAHWTRRRQERNSAVEGRAVQG